MKTKKNSQLKARTKKVTTAIDREAQNVVDTVKKTFTITNQQATRMRKAVHIAIKTDGIQPILPENWGTGHTEVEGAEIKDVMGFPGPTVDRVDSYPEPAVDCVDSYPATATVSETCSRNLLTAGNIVATLRAINGLCDEMTQNMGKIYGDEACKCLTHKAKVNSIKRLVGDTLKIVTPSIKAYMATQVKLLKPETPRRKVQFVEIKETLKTI